MNSKKKPLALLMGITGDLAFAAGCLLQALHRHNPTLEADIILYTDGNPASADATLLRELGANLRVYSSPPYAFDGEAVRQFSLLALARLEGFLLLEEYQTVIWLDVDTAIQGGIAELTGFGPLALALEDPHFTAHGVTSPASINVLEPVDGLDGSAPNLNSGVLVLQDSLPDPKRLYDLCFQWMRANAPFLKYMDQPVLNMLAQKLQKESPGLFSLIPHDKFNAHPRNPMAWKAAVVHAFGAYKLWDDGLTRCAFPEWQRDYERWLEKGGTPWAGPVENPQFLEGGAFSLLTRIYDSTAKAQTLLEGLQAELQKERLLRSKLEKMLEKMG